MSAGEVVLGGLSVVAEIEVVALVDVHHDEVDAGGRHGQVAIRLHVAVLGVARIDVDDGRHGADDPLVGAAAVVVRLGPLHLARLVLGTRRTVELHRLAVRVKLAHALGRRQLVVVHHLAVVQVGGGRVGQPREIPVVALVVFARVEVASAGAQVDGYSFIHETQREIMFRIQQQQQKKKKNKMLTSDGIVGPLVAPVEGVVEVVVAPRHRTEARHGLVEVVLVPVSVGLVRVVDDAGRVEVGLGARDVGRRVQVVVHEAGLVEVEQVLQLIAVEDGVLVRDVARVQQLGSVREDDALLEQLDRRRMVDDVLDELKLGRLLHVTIVHIHGVHLLHDLVNCVVRNPLVLSNQPTDKTLSRQQHQAIEGINRFHTAHFFFFVSLALGEFSLSLFLSLSDFDSLVVEHVYV